ncbi:hypothetical protein KC622_01485 [Candidatus Dojkabacteria bacterium]|uniref:Uncharacterized protein n=1 Tax=Candidatus Dojkabacteria bacterium TaxID=2099670 RepID=A0A955I5N4_9BACT|nr:hypothetical protein [Candidatus Dojkabacteria bacterium]MCB9790610.1 hypothetical protein [Candidatus Nomurabacteria bacterium]
MFSYYISYIKDNPKGYWFRAKLYGWGWTPARWQGWITLLIFVAAVITNSLRFTFDSELASNAMNEFLLETFAMTAVLILVCYIKGEPPRWQWGVPKMYSAPESTPKKQN